MNLTNEQIEQILADAPEGATHVEVIEDEPSEYWMLDSEDMLWHWHKNPKDKSRAWRIGIPELPVENIQSLSDLNEILTLRQRVKELEAQVPKWISVEDELPPKDVWVLWLDGEQTMAPYNDARHIDKIDNRGECVVNYIHNYTHWMPLPQPPKGEGE